MVVLPLPLCFRLVEEMLLERSIDISYETIHRRRLKFDVTYARPLRGKKGRPDHIWYLDEMQLIVRRQDLRHSLRREIAESGLRLEGRFRRRLRGVASADER